MFRPPTLKHIKGILDELNVTPRKQLGQNFLIEKNIIAKILQWAEVRAKDVVIEIGPGLGMLTGALLEAEASLYAIELDPVLYAYLKKNLLFDSFFLKQGDAIDFPLAELPKACENDFKIVANLPYAISTPWLSKVLEGSLPKSLTLLLQKEAARRFTAKPGSKLFSPISLFLQSAYELKFSHKVSPNCFYPRPGVNSELIHLEKKELPYIFKPATKAIIRKLFGHRRKQMQSLCKQYEKEFPILSVFYSILKEKQLTANRPESLAYTTWFELDQNYEKGLSS